MKIIKKYLFTVLIAVFVLLLSKSFGNISHVFADELPEEIKVGQSIDIPKISDYHKCDLSFTPDEEGSFAFVFDYTNISTYNFSFKLYSDAGSQISSYRYLASGDTRKYYVFNKLVPGNKYSLKINVYGYEDSSLKLTCDNAKRYIELADFMDYNNVVISGDKKLLFPYTGKPIDFSKYLLGGYYYDVDGNTIYYTYEIGKDCRINQYTTKINYDTISTEQLKWKSGMPTEKGEYVIRIEGIGSVVGYKDVVITVKNTFDPEYIDINDLKASKQEIELDGKNIFVYAMRAKSAGDYAVFVKCMNSSFSVNMALFDSFGNEIEEKNTGYNGYVTSSVCSMVTLEAGQVCYICLGGYFLSSESADKAKVQISVFGEDSIYIYQDPNAPEIKPGNSTSNNSSNTQSGNSNSKQTSQSGNQQNSSSVKQNPAQQNSSAVKQNTVQQNSSKDNTQKSADTKTNTKTATKKKPLKKGKKFTVKKLTYKVTVSKKGNYQVSLVANKNKNVKKVTIKDTVTYKGVKYKITSIGSKAFAKNKKLTKVTIGKNVKSIGSYCFNKCSKLKTIVIKAKTMKKIGKGAFNGISKKAKITASKKVKAKL